MKDRTYTDSQAGRWAQEREGILDVLAEQGFALYCPGPGAPIHRITHVAEYDALTRRCRPAARAS